MFKSARHKKEFGYYKFAFFPTLLTSNEIIWLKRYFVGGTKHGVLNKFAVGHTKFELLYSDGPIKQ